VTDRSIIAAQSSKLNRKTYFPIVLGKFYLLLLFLENTVANGMLVLLPNM